MQYAFRVYQGAVMARVNTPGDALYFRSPFEAGEGDPAPPDGERVRTYQALNPLGVKHTVYHPHTDIPRSYAVFTEAVERLADALEEVSKNVFSYAIWRNSIRDFESKSYLRLLSQLYRAERPYMVHRVVPFWEVSAQRDLIEVALILRRQVAVAIPPDTFDDVAKIKLAIFDMLQYRRGKNKADPTEDTLDFLELGYELFTEGIPDRRLLDSEADGALAYYQPNHGAACLLDLISCFPTVAEMRAFLTKQYPHVFPAGSHAAELYALEGIDLQAMLPAIFRKAKAEVDSDVAEGKRDTHDNWLFGTMAPPDDLRNLSTS